MKQQLIQPRVLKGFRDYLPEAMIPREALMQTAREVYRSYGFSPIDTPALEYAEILLGKGGDESDKQVFRFQDQGKRDVAMRFDLTVPFARFTSQHLNDIGTPFKRYHIGTVWRGENPQKGRYREFMQCDFDTIGTAANIADIETLLVIHDLLRAIGFEKFTIRVNNRLVLNGLLEKLDLAEQSVGVLRALDKLQKIGADGVSTELTEKVGLTDVQAQQVLKLVTTEGDTETVMSELSTLLAGNERGELGVHNLHELFRCAARAGIPAERIALDVTIARGLDYYTGTIYETFLGDLPGIGSICSGGRYDNLTGLFSKQALPGVGASLGLDRLLAAMEELEMLPDISTPAPVLVILFDAEKSGEYLRIGRELRAAGISTEVFVDPKGVGKQMKYANRKGFQLAIIAGGDEFAAGNWQVKNLQSGEQQTVPEAELIAHVTSVLSSDGGSAG